jgi:threonine/homoserine/homoserine lactone efflux protein
VLTELIPLALVIALSPLSIIPAVLSLSTPHPRPTGVAFLAGWVIGLTVLTIVFLEVSNLVVDLSKPPAWAAWVRVVVGAALIVFGIFRWLNRKRSAHTPGWLKRFGEMTPMRAGITATVLTAANPKVLFMCAAAGLAIGTEGLGSHRVWIGVVWFVVIAASTVAAPILAYVVSGERLDEPLRRVNAWMDEQHSTLVAAILVVIGVLVLYKGIHGL